MASNKKIFDQSTQLDGIDVDAAEIEARRLATYSVAALKVARDVDNIFVLFPTAVNCLRALDRQFQLGTELNMSQGLRLVGPSRVGKTAVLEYFRASLPQSALFAISNAAVGIRV